MTIVAVGPSAQMKLYSDRHDRLVDEKTTAGIYHWQLMWVEQGELVSIQ